MGCGVTWLMRTMHRFLLFLMKFLFKTRNIKWNKPSVRPNRVQDARPMEQSLRSLCPKGQALLVLKVERGKARHEILWTGNQSPRYDYNTNVNFVRTDTGSLSLWLQELQLFFLYEQSQSVAAGCSFFAVSNSQSTDCVSKLKDWSTTFVTNKIKLTYTL